MSSFRFDIVTPAGTFYTGEIEYLRVDTPDGKLGVMHGALPRVTVISAGTIDIRTPVLTASAVCGDGLLSIAHDSVTVLTDSCRYVDADEQQEELRSDDNQFNAVKAKLAASVRRMKKRDSD